MARKNADFKDVELQPTSKMPQCGKIICQSDETKDGSAREWPFMKVGNDCDMDEVWKTLTEGPTRGWDLKKPNLIICVTGGARNYKPRTATRLKALIKDDLISAADTAGAWIMTGGTSLGVMKHVGKAVRDYYIQKPENNNIVALGIASLDYMAKGSDFDEAKARTHFVRYNFVGEKRKDNSGKEAEFPPLDRHHTHFLLVERQAIEFMSKLQQHIHKIEHNVMRVLIVAEGGLNTLKCVKTFIERGCPVVVIAGSGRAADLISEVYSSVKYETRGNSGLTEQEVQDIAKMAADIFEGEEIAQAAVEILKDCFDAGHQLINIFSLEEEDSGTDIQSAILGALFKNSETANTDRLRFAMRWKQCDAATRKILSHQPWNLQERELHDMMLEALVNSQDDFVQLLLDNTVKLRGFLKTETLKKLYNRCMKENHDMKELLTYHFFTKPSRSCTRFKAAPDPTIPKHVLLFINEVMIHLFKDPHFSFYPHEEEPKSDLYDHPQRELFLWAILFNREKLSLRFWKAGRDHIGGALCASVLLKRLSARAEKKDMAELSQSLARHSVVWEERAVAVLAECHSRDHDKTRQLLVREQLHWAPRALDVADTKGKKAKTIERPSLLNIVESYELMEFAGHSACQTKLSFIWNGRLSRYTATWKVFLCVIFPVLLLSPIFKFTIVNSGDGSRSNEPNRKGNRVSDQNGQSPTEQEEYRSVQRSMRVSCFSLGAENKKIPRLKALLYFWTAPITKFAFNVLSYVAYLSMLSYFMLVELNEVSPSLVEYITWVWLATMIMEELRQMLFGNRLSLKYRLRNWVRSLWNQFDVALYLIFLVAIALRFLLPPAGGDFRWVRAFYSVALVLSYLRLLQFFYAVKSVGPKVIMIQKMMGDVLLFLSLLLVFLIGFGVAYHINIFPESPPDWYMLINIVYFPYFQIFGELFLDSMKGEVVDGCETNKTLWRLNPSTRCPEKSPVLMSLMLGVYLIVTNILLVNLLIAMFSNTFRIVQENSLRLWRYNRLSLVHEYFDRPVFAPPIIVLDYIYRVVSYVFCCHRWRSRKNVDNRFRIELSKEEHEAMTLFEKKAMLHSKAAEAPKERHDLGRKNVSEA